MDFVSSEQRNKIHPHKFMMWIAIGSIIMMFAGLTSAYVVKSRQAGWKEVEITRQFWFSTTTILLSSVTMQMALRSFKQREMNKYRVLISLTTVLGILFLFLQWSGFLWLWNSGVRFTGSGAGQFLYVIAGLHAVHVFGGIIALLVQAIKAYSAQTKHYNTIPIEIVSTYWHFVDF